MMNRVECRAAIKQTVGSVRSGQTELPITLSQCHRVASSASRRTHPIKFIIEIRVRMNASVKRAWRRNDFNSLCDFVAAPVRITFHPCDCSFQDRRWEPLVFVLANFSAAGLSTYNAAIQSNNAIDSVWLLEAVSVAGPMRVTRGDGLFPGHD
jgi:hypothetical protein